MDNFVKDQSITIDKNTLSDPIAEQTLTGAFPQLVQQQLEAMENDELDIDGLSHENKKLLGVANYLESLIANNPDAGNQATLESAQHFADTAKMELATHLAVEDLQTFMDDSLEYVDMNQANPENSELVIENQTKVMNYLQDKNINPVVAMSDGARMRQHRMEHPREPGSNDLPVLSIGNDPELTITKADLGEELKELSRDSGELELYDILHFDKEKDEPLPNSPSIQDQVEYFYREASTEYEVAKTVIDSPHNYRMEPEGGDSVYAQKLKQYSQAIDIIKNDPELMHELETSPVMQEPEMQELMDGLSLEEAFENTQDLMQHLVEEDRLQHSINHALEARGLEPLHPSIQPVPVEKEPEPFIFFEDGPLEIEPQESMNGTNKEKQSPETSGSNRFKPSDALEAETSAYGRPNPYPPLPKESEGLDVSEREPSSFKQQTEQQYEERYGKPMNQGQAPTVHARDGISANQQERNQQTPELQMRSVPEDMMPNIDTDEIERGIMKDAIETQRSLDNNVGFPNRLRDIEGPGF